MIGTFVNVGTILAGSLIGSVVNRGIKDEYQGAMFNAMGLAAVMLGVSSAVSHMPESRYPVLFIASLAAGSLLGTILDLDGRFKKLTGVLRFGSSNLGEGLSTAVLLFCIGTMSIVGPIERGKWKPHLSLHQCYTGFRLFHCPGIYLWDWDCPGRSCAVLLAGGHLYGCQLSGRLSLRAADGGNLHRGRSPDCHLRPLDLKYKRL